MPKYPVTKKLLTMLKARYGHGKEPASDYKIAQMLGVTRGAVSNWTCGRSGMNDDIGVIVADMLELDSDLVLAELNLDRANSLATRQFYESIIKRIQSSAALAVAAFAGLHLLFPSPLIGA